MQTSRLRARDAEALVWLGEFNLPLSAYRSNPGRPPISRLQQATQAAARGIAVGSAVLAIHLAALKYIFLAA